MKFSFLFFLLFGKVLMLSNVMSSDDEDSDNPYDLRTYSSSAPTRSTTFYQKHYLPRRKGELPTDVRQKAPASKGLPSKFMLPKDKGLQQRIDYSDEDEVDSAFNAENLEDLISSSGSNSGDEVDADSDDDSGDDSGSDCSTRSGCSSVSTNSHGEKVRYSMRETVPGVLCQRILIKQSPDKRQSLADIPKEITAFFVQKINRIDEAAQLQAEATSLLYNTLSPTKGYGFLGKNMRKFHATIGEEGIEESIFKDVIDYYVELQITQVNKTLKKIFKKEKKLKNWIEYEKNTTKTLHKLCEILNNDPYHYTEYTDKHKQLVLDYVTIHCDHLVLLYENRSVASAATEGARGSSTKLALESFQKNIPEKLNRIFGGAKKKKRFSTILKPLFNEALESMNKSQTPTSQTIASVCSSVSTGVSAMASYIPSIFGGAAPKPAPPPPTEKGGGWW